MDRIPNLITGVASNFSGLREKLEAASDGEMIQVFGPDEVPPSPEYVLDLPWPPSMNAYWGLRITKTGQRIIVVTKKGTDYQKLVRSLVAMRWKHPPIDYRISMLTEAWAPSQQYAEGNRWEWDVNNRVKPLEDALAKAGVMTNDKLIRDSRIVDRGIDPPGRVRVWLRPFAGY